MYSAYYLIKHLLVFVVLTLLVLAPSVALSEMQSQQVDHPSLLYQERFSYTLMLFEAIARQSPEVVNSTGHHQAEELVRSAKALHEQNDYDLALSKLNDVISLLESLSSQRPPQLREERRYLSLLEGLPYFQSAYQRHYQEALEKKDGELSFGYDQQYVEALLLEAKAYAGDGRFGEGAVLLRTAQEQIASAIKALLDHTQIGVVAYPVTSSVVLGRSPEEIAEEEYTSAVASISHFRDAHKRQHHVEQFDVVGYDVKLVEWLLVEAKSLADDGRYQAALEIVTHVRSLITKALRDTLNGQEVVVKLDISTPELEFAYEHRRYQGYEELIPIALERMRPDDETLKLMSYYVEQGKKMEQKALVTAELPDFPVAIRMVLDATRAVQMALRTVGVPIYDAR